MIFIQFITVDALAQTFQFKTEFAELRRKNQKVTANEKISNTNFTLEEYLYLTSLIHVVGKYVRK